MKMVTLVTPVAVGTWLFEIKMRKDTGKKRKREREREREERRIGSQMRLKLLCFSCSKNSRERKAKQRKREPALSVQTSDVSSEEKGRKNDKVKQKRFCHTFWTWRSFVSFFSSFFALSLLYSSCTCLYFSPSIHPCNPVPGPWANHCNKQTDTE